MPNGSVKDEVCVRKRRKTWLLLLILALLVPLSALAGYLMYRGTVRFNGLFASRYPVRGVDVSNYQGDIDWPLLAQQDVGFAFIKATEGRDFLDQRFETNLENARQTGIRVGAYHYFTFTSSGEDQARHFISVVPKFDGMLPPVIDLEFDAAKSRNMLDRPTVIRELAACLDALEAHYGLRPIIYAPVSAYRAYVKGDFDDYDLWIRNVYFPPALFGIGHWTFWQYADNGQLQGYTGPEKNIDLNVYAGSADQFAKYPAATAPAP